MRTVAGKRPTAVNPPARQVGRASAGRLGERAERSIEQAVRAGVTRLGGYCAGRHADGADRLGVPDRRCRGGHDGRLGESRRRHVDAGSPQRRRISRRGRIRTGIRRRQDVLHAGHRRQIHVRTDPGQVRGAGRSGRQRSGFPDHQRGSRPGRTRQPGQHLRRQRQPGDLLDPRPRRVRGSRRAQRGVGQVGQFGRRAGRPDR